MGLEGKSLGTYGEHRRGRLRQTPSSERQAEGGSGGTGSLWVPGRKSGLPPTCSQQLEGLSEGGG